MKMTRANEELCASKWVTGCCLGWESISTNLTLDVKFGWCLRADASRLKHAAAFRAQRQTGDPIQGLFIPSGPDFQFIYIHTHSYMHLTPEWHGFVCVPFKPNIHCFGNRLLLVHIFKVLL